MKVDAILTSDWHLRLDTPKCRLGDFRTDLFEKVLFVKRLQKKYKCPVLHAGDLFHRWRVSSFLESMAIVHLPDQFYTVYGQHELPEHNFELRTKSGTHLLETAGKIKLVDTHFGFTPEKESLIIKGRKILIWHKFIWDGKKLPWPGCEESTALEVLKEYPQFDLILTGDHHKPFVKEYKGRILVNPGCLSRQVADYYNHRPRVYLYNAEINTVKLKFIPIKPAEEVITKDHIEKERQKNDRVDAFVTRLNSYGISLSFENNVDSFFRSNLTRKDVKNLVYKAIE